MIAVAEWAPESYRDLDGNFRQQKIELAIMHGATVGLGAFAAVQSIAIINGMPSIWGDGALSVIEHSGLLEDMVEDYELDGEEGLIAICTMKRRHRATPIVTRFSMGMADRAGLTKIEGPWQSYPERMLRMRARSWTMRDAFADVLRGLHIREEIEDYAGTAAVSTRSAGRTSTEGFAGPNRPRLPRPRFTAPAGRSSTIKHSEEVADPTAQLTTGRDQPLVAGSDRNSAAPQSLTTELEMVPTASAAAPHIDTGINSAPSEPHQTFTLADAEGGFIDFSGAEALRSAFERLFLDSHLPPGQILGLWEANEDARRVITETFGSTALDEAEEHLRVATQQYEEQRATRRSAAGRSRSRVNRIGALSAGTATNGPAPKGGRPIHDAAA